MIMMMMMMMTTTMQYHGMYTCALLWYALQAMDDLAFCGFRMYDERRQPWGSVPEYFDKGIKMKQLSGGQRHLVCVTLSPNPSFVPSC